MKSGIYPKEKRLVVDNHSLEQFRTCPRKFSHRIEQDLIPIPDRWEEGDPIVPGFKLQFGISIHHGLDVLWQKHDVEGAKDAFLNSWTDSGCWDEDRRRNSTTGLRMIDDYWERHGEWLESIETVATEAHFGHQLGVVPDSDGWEVYYHGKIDKIGKEDGELFLCDHKTTAWESANMASTYELSNQLYGYMYGVAAFLGFKNLQFALIDILVANPVNHSFIRSRIYADSEQMAEWKQDILQTARHILDCYERNIWPKYGKDACSKWNNECEFFGICRTTPTLRKDVTTVNYTTLPWDPDER